MALNRDRACRLCWLQRARLRRATGDPRLSYARALEDGWVQLSFANTRPQERRPHSTQAPPGAKTRSVLAALAPAAHRQLVLFPPPPRDLAAALHRLPIDTALADWLGQELTDWAAARGWTRSTASRARCGLRLLLAVQDTPGAPVPASGIDQLTQVGLPARLLHEFLTARRFVEDDRTLAIDAFFARLTAGLPEPMTAQLARWMSLRLTGSPTPPRSRPRSPATVRHQLSFALPVLARLAAAGTRDLADITTAQLREHLSACRLTGTAYTHTASGLIAVFTLLHAHRIIRSNPAVHLRVGTPTPTIPLPADTAPIRQALNDPDPARAAITALLAFHALRALEIRHLTLTDARDLAAGHLHLPDRTVLLAEPVQARMNAYLTHRGRRWPNTANPHFFITRRTALSTTPVSRPWLYRHYPASSHLLRSDRIVDEVQAADGDIRLICDLFGLSIQAATRYTAATASTSITPSSEKPKPSNRMNSSA
ncbi:hypothetical protein ACFVY0_43070 [Streptomyces sp. NPDC058286]|uniref:hypothetical protein n=1 Tax=Streptomyces sp. NPDC058286 TaxID=3346422 RepID=UPI0036E52007